MKALVLTNSVNGLFNFRKELIERLIEEKFEVMISSPQGIGSNYFARMGCYPIETSINRRGTNPISDLSLFYHYFKIIERIKPDVVLTYTIKPNIYGGIVCRLLKVPYITNITGLGSALVSRGFLQHVTLFLYRLAIRDAWCVFFQNNGNRQFFVDNNAVGKKHRLIPGSGVNLQEHCFENYPENDGNNRFLFIGRVMKDKGIEELLQAAIIVKNKYKNVEFDAIGSCEKEYEGKIAEWKKAGVVFFHGFQQDAHTFIKRCHAVILPSHHEGMANVLLEASATGRPVLASNIPGCKEAFDEGVSGFGFEPKDVDSLVKTIIKFIELPYDQKKAMGRAARLKMEKEFNRDIVVNAYMEEIDEIIKAKGLK